MYRLLRFRFTSRLGRWPWLGWCHLGRCRLDSVLGVHIVFFRPSVESVSTYWLYCTGLQVRKA